METVLELCNTAKPSEALYLYKDRIKEYLLLYKARGDHKFLLLNQRAQKIFSACTGQRTVQEIYSFLRGSDYKETEIKATIEALLEENVLRVVGEPKQTITPTPSNSGRTLGIWLHVTNSCNLRCSYCYIDKDKGSMELHIAEKTILNAIDQCSKYGIPNFSVKFAGGEPLTVWKNILHIVDFTREHCQYAKITPSFNILSNGTLMRKDIAEYLKANQIPIAISLDGLRDVNDLQRFYINGRGSFGDVEQGIRILQEVGWSPFILITITEKNVSGLRELTSYLLRQGLGFRYSFVRDCDQMPMQDLFDASSRYAEVLHKCFDDIEEWMFTRNWNFNVKFCDTNLDRSISRACGTGKNSVAVDHNGSIALCQMVFDTPIGHIEKNGLLEAVETQQVIPELRQNTVDDYLGCNECTWKNVCAGGCPVFTYKQLGTIKTSSLYCSAFKSLIPRVVRLRGIKLLRAYET